MARIAAAKQKYGYAAQVGGLSGPIPNRIGFIQTGRSNLAGRRYRRHLPSDCQSQDAPTVELILILAALRTGQASAYRPLRLARSVVEACFRAFVSYGYAPVKVVGKVLSLETNLTSATRCNSWHKDSMSALNPRSSRIDGSIWYGALLNFARAAVCWRRRRSRTRSRTWRRCRPFVACLLR